MLRTAIPDLRITLNDQFGEADRVVSRWTGSGTHTGPLNLPTSTLAGTGHGISFDEIRIDRHVGGRIGESWWIPDRFTLWTQLGLLPAPPVSAPPGGHAQQGTRPMKYTGDAALPSVTDEMLHDALGTIRPYTVCILKAGPGFREPGPARPRWVADLIWEHGKRNYALYLAGVKRVICPVTDDSAITGVSIFDTDPGEVVRIMQEDPAVKAGLFAYEIHATQTFRKAAWPTPGRPSKAKTYGRARDAYAPPSGWPFGPKATWMLRSSVPRMTFRSMVPPDTARSAPDRSSMVRTG
jgi:hypothetical protein